MNESGLNRMEKGFDEVVAMMTYANPDIKDALSIDTAYSSSTTVEPKPYRRFYFITDKQFVPLIKEEKKVKGKKKIIERPAEILTDEKTGLEYFLAQEIFQLLLRV